MFRAGSGSAGWLAAIIFAVVVGAAPSGAQELRTVLANGDDVARFGRIGVWGVHLAGIDERGRALIARFDGEREDAFWADGERFVPLLSASELGGVRFIGRGASVESGGAVLGFGLDESGAYTLYSVVDEQLNAIVRRGDRDADGNMFCELRGRAINAAGTVAFTAVITPAPRDCDVEAPDEVYYEALYVADGGLRRVFATGALSPPGWEVHQISLFAFNDAGEAIVHVWGSPSGVTPVSDQHVLAVGPDGLRIVHRFGDVDAPGQIGLGTDPGWFQLLSVNAAGEVAVRRHDEVLAVYRSAAGRMIRVLGVGEPTAWGEGTYTELDAYASAASFKVNGDLLLTFYDHRRLVLFPSDAGPRVFADTDTGYANARRDVAALQRTGEYSVEVVRYRNGTARQLAATGDRLPGGGALADDGIGAACMAPNGAVAASVLAADGSSALACGDSRGFRAVSRMGDPRPDNRRFYSFDACAFGDAETLVFVGSGLVSTGRPRAYLRQSAVYRATPQRLDRVLGRGDVLEDGSVISGLLSGWDSLLDTDSSGRVMALAATDAGAALVLAEADGTLRRMPLRLRNDNLYNDRIVFEPNSSVDHEYLSGISARPSPARGSGGRAALRGMPAPDPTDPDAIWISSGGLAASGGLFIVGSQQRQEPEGEWRERSVILHVTADAVRPIVEAGDPFGYVDSLRVSGDRIVFQEISDRATIYSYKLGDVAPVAVVSTGDASPVGPLRYPFPIGLTADGEVHFLDRPEGASEQLVLAVRDGALRVIGPVFGIDQGSNAVSDDGAILLANQDKLQVAGPGPRGASCPVPPILPSPPAAPTPTARPGEEPLPPNLPFEPQRCSGGTCISIGNATGRADDLVSIDVWMDDGGTPVVATENELHFPLLAEIQDCVANPAINKNGSAFRIGGEFSKAIIISLTDVDPIPSGSTLYTCQVHIAADAPNGYYKLGCAYPGAASPEGEEVFASCADGILTVEGDNTGEAPQLAGGGSSGGCAVQPTTDASGAILLLGALGLLVAVRRRA